MSEALQILTLLITVALLAFAAANRWKPRPTATEPSTDLVPLPPMPELEIVELERSEGGNRVLAVHIAPDFDLCTIELLPRALPMAQRGAIELPVEGFFAPLLTQAGVVAEAVAGAGHLRITFSAETLAKLASGEYQLMEAARGTLSIAVNSQGRIVEHAHVVSGISSMSALGVALGGLGAAAAAIYQMQIAESLQRLERQVDALTHRVRDGDWGVLAAADALIDEVRAALPSAGLASQFRLELAAAAMRVDEVYFARKRALARLPGSRGEMETLADDEDPGALSRRVLIETVERIGGNVEGFIEEVDLALAALLTRARVKSLRGIALALDGEVSVGQSLVHASREQLSDEIEMLVVRLNLLSRTEKSRIRRFLRLPDQTLRELQSAAGDLHTQVVQLRCEIEAPVWHRAEIGPASAPAIQGITQFDFARSPSGEWVYQ